ncbi:MAG: amylo-alpha-1,6-glucosidase [bacterium]
MFAVKNNRTRISRMRPISTDFKSVFIRLIRVICVPLKFITFGCFVLLLLDGNLLFASDKENEIRKELAINFSGDAKIEVGSYFVGLEFHHSYPVPQRISFYYPVANSIDLSTDYWKRDTTYISEVGIKFGDKETEWLNGQSFPFELTPFSVDFSKSESDKQIDISYRFTKNKPAFVVSYSITNKTNVTAPVELYMRNAVSLRTCHTFTLRDEVEQMPSNDDRIVLLNNLSAETKNAQLFLIDAGEKASQSGLSDEIFPQSEFVKAPAVNYIYKKELKPGGKLEVIQIVGSCFPGEGVEIAAYLKSNYYEEVEEFETSILQNISRKTTFVTGDKILDRSALWAKAILEVSKHYIDGDIEPMPCPAEYNFYFTHDVLLTDLAAVNFDLERVKNDLGFIVKHANPEKIIPHAYYWKDSSFVTEFADHDNWNNFWFIIASASYLRHSSDNEFVKGIFPYVEKSLSQAMLTKGEDDLMWSFRPDWWDIGRRYGQRCYMTILAIKAIHSYLYLSSALDIANKNLIEYEKLASRMTEQLNNKLWMDQFGYLMNYTDPDKIDPHYYSGSLLAAHYNLLTPEKISKMIETANEKIVDPAVGAYTAYPMDFDELQEFWHFVNNEAGDKYYYLNGGIWSQSNAWYALALIAADKKVEALEFIKNVSTLDGILNGPNGQPAMYEVRNGNKNSPAEYGTIDKPQFMWAAGWYLYSLYNLYGIKENDWNVTFNPYLSMGQKECIFNLTIGNNVEVVLQKNATAQVVFDNIESNSFVVPHKTSFEKSISFAIGKITQPFLTGTNSILESCDFNSESNEMEIKLNAFQGHHNTTIIVSPDKPKEIQIDGDKIIDCKIIEEDGHYKIQIDSEHKDKLVYIKIKF